MFILRQSTAVDVLIGPFVDGTDGVTTEEAESPSVQLSKNGETAATKNDVTTPTHDNAGYYNCEFDATDTNTVGTLVAFVEGATGTFLQVRHEFQIMDTAAFDALFADGAEGPLQATTVGNTLDVSATGEAGLDWANIGSPTTAQNLSGTNIDVDQIVASVSGNVDGVVTGANDIAAAEVWAVDATTEQTLGTFGQAIGDPVTDATTIYQAVATDAAGDNVAVDVVAVKAETALIVADTSELQVDDVPGLIGALNDLAASDVLTQVNAALDTAISELGVAAPAITPTIRTALMLLYMVLRNQFKTQTVATDAVEIYNDAGTLITKKVITDDGSDYVEAKMS